MEIIGQSGFFSFCWFLGQIYFILKRSSSDLRHSQDPLPEILFTAWSIEIWVWPQALRANFCCKGAWSSAIQAQEVRVSSGQCCWSEAVFRFPLLWVRLWSLLEAWVLHNTSPPPQLFQPTALLPLGPFDHCLSSSFPILLEPKDQFSGVSAISCDVLRSLRHQFENKSFNQNWSQNRLQICNTAWVEEWWNHWGFRKRLLGNV